MNKKNFYHLLQKEMDNLKKSKVSKLEEKIIEGFTHLGIPKAVIGKNKYLIFNSNDYLGLRHHSSLIKAEGEASRKYGTGPGAVRFISGTMKIHKQLEERIAKFHHRDDAIVFSSAFAANMAVIFCFVQGRGKDSGLSEGVVVISDMLNHRSIIDGIRVAGLSKEKKVVFAHLDLANLEKTLKENFKNNKRAIVVTDGIFSMLGEYQKIGKMHKIIDRFDKKYELGVLLIIDDSHGVGAFGKTGRGVEEVENARGDILVGTFGKSFGADGGYAVGDQVLIDYLRESAATYIFSNSISPGTAGAANQAVEILDKKDGKKLLTRLGENIEYFKQKAVKFGFQFAADSVHPIQPLLIGDPVKTKNVVDFLYKKKILVTNISFPVVPKGRDEIRI
ncbi:aminotransferase class I/II-fold pyridoxal phosphate-dependent enzyme, partial [Candidatus Gottesmanbacteria bacterium]|nr:aminotransferase class I/II-fold pyridoxal phosphate-dependent enzyme [Candidatus Gottesmanbacteria bacterium]